MNSWRAEKVYGSDGLKFGITPKNRAGNDEHRGDTLREKLGRSPNRADAVVYLYDGIRSMQQAAPRRLPEDRVIAWNLSDDDDDFDDGSWLHVRWGW